MSPKPGHGKGGPIWEPELRKDERAKEDECPEDCAVALLAPLNGRDHFSNSTTMAVTMGAMMMAATAP